MPFDVIYKDYKVFKKIFGPSCILKIHMHTYKALHITVHTSEYFQSY